MEDDGDEGIMDMSERTKDLEDDESCSDEEEQDSSGDEDDYEDDEDDEESDDSSEQASEDEDDGAVSSDSSSSNDNVDGCAICLSSFKGQEVGVPESCDHNFCVDCIIEWSKNVNTCPIDRQEFHMIAVKRRLGGKTYKTIPVQVDSGRSSDYDVLDDTTACEVCGATDNEDRLLLCDSCNHGYHTYCLTPRLDHIPRGDWYCPVCRPALEVSQNQEVTVSSDEEMSDSEPVHLGRTMVLERVRQMVARIRKSRANVIHSDPESNEDASREAVPGPSVSHRRRKRCRKTRKRRRKVVRKKQRKTGSRKTKKSKSKVTRRKRRKCKRTKKKVKKIRTTTIAKRLSARLGIKPCIEGSRLIIKARRKKAPLLEAPHINTTSLDIMGDYNQVIPYSDHSDSEMDTNQSGTCVVARPAVHHIGPRVNLKQVSARETMSSASDMNTDILGTILDGQNLLLADSDSVIITRDGRLKWDTNNNRCKQRGDNSVSRDRPQDGDNEQTDGQTGKEGHADKSSSSECAAGQVNSTSDQGTSCNGSCEMSNATHAEGIGSTHCVEDTNKRTDSENTTTKSKTQPTDSSSAQRSGSPSPNSGRTHCEQPTAQPSETSAKHDSANCDSDRKADVMADGSSASDWTGDTPVPSYLYSPDSPTSGTDSAHIGSPAPAVTDGGSTPVVDELSTSVTMTTDGATTDLFHIVPFCDLPKIPKIKKKPPPPEGVPVQTRESSASPPYAGVLERINMADKLDTYPKWDKSEHGKVDRRRKSGEVSEGVTDEDGDSPKRSHHSDHQYRDHHHHHHQDEDEESGSSYKRARSRSRDRDKSYDREKDRRYDRRHKSDSDERARRRSGSRSREHRSDYTRSRRSRSRSRSPRYRDHHIHDRYKDHQDRSVPPAGRRYKLKRSFSSEIGSRCSENQQSDGRDNKLNPFFSEIDPDVRDCPFPDGSLPKQVDLGVDEDCGTSDFAGGPSSVASPEPSPVFKMPEAPPPRFHKRDSIHLAVQSPDLTYDPSQPTESERSPPHIEDLLRAPSHLPHLHRQSQIHARLPYAEVVHRGPLLADPSPPREPHAAGPPHFVTVPESLRQMLPPLPGFGILQPNLHARNMRPPLLVNPPLISAHQIGRLPHLAGPQISWQAVSHPNVIIHNRIPIQVNQNGLPIHPNGPEAFLQPPPPPRLEHPVPQSIPDSLATPPPPIPPKALEEMQQISQLLNAQAQLADIATKGDGVVQFREAPGQFANSQCFLGPPAVMPNKPSEAKSVTFEEKMEVIDMDVASPLSDQMAVSGSPANNAADMDTSHKHASKSDNIPKSAAELDSNEKRLRQERVVEEVKLAIKPHYSKGRVDKEEYKEILRKAVPKICHSKSGDINPERIRKYIEQYVEKVRRARKHGNKNKLR